MIGKWIVRSAWATVMFALACVAAGAYGVLHNQISYTVSPEYFTKFKFIQFSVGPILRGRVGAGVVGWAASWWMGALIAMVLIPLTWRAATHGQFVRTLFRAYGVVVLTTLAVGLIALAGGFIFIDASIGSFERYGLAIDDDVAFARAGNMHNFSYLGGVIGVITGGWTAIRGSRRSANDA